MSDHANFRIGFIEGYRSVRGGNVIVPTVPAAPIFAVGTSAFRVGLDVGEAAARR